MAETVNDGEDYAGTTFTMTQDIDLNGNESNQWMPIGSQYAEKNSPYSRFFSGTFDGGGYEITELYIDDGEFGNNDCNGLFGYIGEEGIVKNLTVDGSVTGNYYIGGIVGRNAGTVINCHNSCDVTGSGSYYHENGLTISIAVGGIAGNSGTVTNCYNTGNVTGNGNCHIGGIVGYSVGAVTNCYNFGNVTAGIEEYIGYIDIGGIIGWGSGSGKPLTTCYNTGKIVGIGDLVNIGGIVGYTRLNPSLVENCYNTGTVTGAGHNVNIGGITGYHYFMAYSISVQNCYNTGAITCIGDENGWAGGIVRYLKRYYGSDSETIKNCYSTGNIVCKGSDSYVGGIVGYHDDNPSAAKNCYYLEGTAPGGIKGTDTTGRAERLTADAFRLTSNFKGWDFSNIWKISESKARPVLMAIPESGSMSGGETPDTPADDPINNDNVFIKQSVTGRNGGTCTLTSVVMMLRRRAILDGRQDWESITEQSVRKIAWGSSGLAAKFDVLGMHVERRSLDDYERDPEKVKSFFLSLLNTHPEGVAVGTWEGTYGVQTHAILLTDYDSSTGTFYCSDPAPNARSGRISFVGSTIKGGTQDKILSNLDQYWLITSNRNEKTLISSTFQSRCPVEMLVTINNTVLDSRTISGTSASNDYARMEVSAVEDGKNITANINGDYAKTGDVQVNLFGTDTGEMTFTVTHHFSDGTEETNTFRNVPLTETTTGYAAAIYPQSTVLLTMTDTTNPENPTYWAAGPSETVTEPTTDFDAFPDDDSSSGSNNSSPNTPDGGDEEDPDDSEEETPEEEFIPLEGYLETEDHLVYISGDDDLVHPDGKLTRAEAAAMIYSLLRTKPDTVSLHFADVAQGAWYQPQVDTLAELGVVVGMGESLNGPLYAPNANITRAEFSVILSRFFSMETGKTNFKDLDPNAWYYPFMSNAVLKGWVSGYEDGTARPNANITRTEAITLLNKMLGRSADAAKIDAYGTDGKIFRFLDLPLTHWAYYHIMEASTPHTYETGATSAETWKEFSVPTAAREPGYRLYSGSLYKIDNTGHYVRNLTDGVLRFGSDGKYTTGNATLDTYLRNAVRSNTVESDTLENNWKRLYKYAGGNSFSYLNRAYLTDGQTGWEVEKALQMFNTHKGNCYNYAAVTTFLARSMGYQATAMSGFAYMPQNGYYVCHGWTQIDIGGVNYVADPELQYSFAARNNVTNWDLFMKRYSAVVPKYRWKGTVLQ